MQKLLTFLSSKNVSIYAIFNDQSFKDTLTNDIVSIEQLGPGIYLATWIFRVVFYHFLFLFSDPRQMPSYAEQPPPYSSATDGVVHSGTIGETRSTS